MATEETSPQAAAATRRLRNWAVKGPGATLFAWGTEGSYRRCLAFYKDKVPGHMVEGWCANLYHEATGTWPGRQHGDKD